MKTTGTGRVLRIVLSLLLAAPSFAATPSRVQHFRFTPDAPGVLPPTGTLLFVTQVPVTGFGTVTSSFATHQSDLISVRRGGDLMIRYPDGTLRNLTKLAGYGVDGAQDGPVNGPKAIAVREPSVYWDGTKALFSMVIGGSKAQFDIPNSTWQIYEVTGFGPGQTPVISKVPNQPQNVNNVSPLYGTDNRILFTSDLPRSGVKDPNLYPQVDEYESHTTVSGLWSINPGAAGGDLKLLNHSPSGMFSPFIDSFGRVLFIQWDHLQRDQQVDPDAIAKFGGQIGLTFPNEASTNGTSTVSTDEVFPEPRVTGTAAGNCGGAGDVLNCLEFFNHFFPWEVREDGTEVETLNHVGRQEFGGVYTQKSFRNDPALSDTTPQSAHDNTNYVDGFGGLMQMKEDPLHPGEFFAVHAAEFGVNASGVIAHITGAGLNADADDMRIVSNIDLTQSSTLGHFRDPLPLTTGALIASHTTQTADATTADPAAYDFRLKVMLPNGSGYKADVLLIPGGINKTVTWTDGDDPLDHSSYSGPLWELNAVEVRSRPRTALAAAPLAAPEVQAFNAAGVTESELKTWLAQNNLALIVSRNVTQRDRADVQQPYNLRVPGTGGAQSVVNPGSNPKIYDITHLQLYQGDQIRGYLSNPGGQESPGRRVIAQFMHDPKAVPWIDANGAAPIGKDGSVAAFVPARRAMTWQLTAPDNSGVVRERNWVTFQPGEIRTCASCHGINTKSQTGAAAPANMPQALVDLLNKWKVTPH